MTIHPNNTPDPTTTAPAVHVDKLSFRYRSLDDDPQPKRTAAAPAAEPPEQANAIEDISFSLPSGKLMLIRRAYRIFLLHKTLLPHPV